MIASIVYFVITIAILVFVHEFGHFIAAKLSKMRVDIFSIGFGPRIIGWNKKIGLTFGNLAGDFDGEGNTDYRLSIVPLGGYVKIAGMIDESMDSKNLSSEVMPWEYRAKKPLAKMFVISAGVLMNLVLAYFIFFANNAIIGKQVLKTTTIGPIPITGAAYQAGLAQNDKILAINNVPVDSWDAVTKSIYLENVGKDITFKIQREGINYDVFVKRSVIPVDPSKGIFILPAHLKPIVSDILKNAPADKAKIKVGDVLYSVNDTVLVSSEQTVKMISAHTLNTIKLKILREKDTITMYPTPGKDGKLGIGISEIYNGPIDIHKYGIGESFVKSATDIGSYTVLTFSMLKNVFTGKLAFKNAFGGPLKIAQFAAKSAENGLVSFLNFIAMLSLSLAIINILPIPALDGGHLLVEIIEAIIRRELPLKTKMLIQNIGMYLLFALMAFIIYSDVISFLGK